MNLIFNIIKVFSGVFVFMSIMLYNTYNDAISFELERYKVKIENTVNDVEKKNLIKEYDTYVDEVLKLYTPDNINLEEDINTIKLSEKKKPKFQLFTNIASTIISITILLCTIYLINNSTLLNRLYLEETKKD